MSLIRTKNLEERNTVKIKQWGRDLIDTFLALVYSSHVILVLTELAVITLSRCHIVLFMCYFLLLLPLENKHMVSLF